MRGAALGGGLRFSLQLYIFPHARTYRQSKPLCGKMITKQFHCGHIGNLCGKVNTPRQKYIFSAGLVFQPGGSVALWRSLSPLAWLYHTGEGANPKRWLIPPQQGQHCGRCCPFLCPMPRTNLEKKNSLEVYIERTSVIWGASVPKKTCAIYQSLLNCSERHGYAYGRILMHIQSRLSNTGPVEFVERFDFLYREGWVRVSSVEVEGKVQTIFIPNESPLFEDIDTYPDEIERVLFWYSPDYAS